MSRILCRLLMRTHWVVVSESVGTTLSGFASRLEANQRARWLNELTHSTDYYHTWRFK